MLNIVSYPLVVVSSVCRRYEGRLVCCLGPCSRVCVAPSTGVTSWVTLIIPILFLGRRPSLRPSVRRRYWSSRTGAYKHSEEFSRPGALVWLSSMSCEKRRSDGPDKGASVCSVADNNGASAIYPRTTPARNYWSRLTIDGLN